jgi:protein-disulfide isomerase
MQRFRDALKRRTYEDYVREDFRRGVENGVYGTPALFINGVRDNGPLEQDSLLTQLKATS